MSKEDALKARDKVLRGIVARLKGEYERQLAAGEQQRKALIEDREKSIVDLVRAKKDSDDKSEQVEFEKSVAAKAAENLAKVQQERDAFKLELSNVKVELSKSGQQSDQRIKDLVAERDALAQQQANLSKQITEFQKRGKIGASVADVAAVAAGGAAAAAAVERSQKEYQRQIEELQRRINVLETAQRDTAQELGRERDSKLKAERALAAADRLQQDSASKIQEQQAALQREHETTLRKRDADAGRGLKDIQDQTAALQQANAKLATDLADSRKKLAAAQETIAAAPNPEEWQARMAAQFEGDIDSYRTRIKALLQEKEALNTEKQKLASELASREKALAEHGEAKQTLSQVEADHKYKCASEDALPVAVGERVPSTNPELKSLQAEHDDLNSNSAPSKASKSSTTRSRVTFPRHVPKTKTSRPSSSPCRPSATI